MLQRLRGMGGLLSAILLFLIKKYRYQFQKTSELKPRPNTKVDDLWGPQLFHIIQKSRDTQLWSLADDALRELNALQRSAKAYDENKSKVGLYWNVYTLGVVLHIECWCEMFFFSLRFISSTKFKY